MKRKVYRVPTLRVQLSLVKLGIFAASTFLFVAVPCHLIDQWRAISGTSSFGTNGRVAGITSEAKSTWIPILNQYVDPQSGILITAGTLFVLLGLTILAFAIADDVRLQKSKFHRKKYTYKRHH
jgi:hypothetical protein